MALTLITQPPLICFVGGVSQKPARAGLSFTSNLFPINLVDTARTITAHGTTSQGFLFIDISAAFAADFVAGNLVTIAGQVRRVLSTSTPLEYRIVLDNPIAIVNGVTTIIKSFESYGVEVSVTQGANVITQVFNVLSFDISDMLAVIQQNNFKATDATFLTADVVIATVAYREVFQGSATSYINLAATRQITRGRLDQAEAMPTGENFFCTRPDVSRGYEGQSVPLAFYITDENASTFIEDYIAFELRTAITASNRQRLIITQLQKTAGNTFNEFIIGIDRKKIIVELPRLPFVELSWRSRKGTWESHFFYLTAKTATAQKGDQFRLNNNETALVNGSTLTNKGRSFFVSDLQESWTMDSGKIGEQEAEWIKDVLNSEEVLMRNGLNYYPVNVLPTSSLFYQESQLDQISFDITSAFEVALQAPAGVVNPDLILSEWLKYLAYLATQSALYDTAALACAFSNFQKAYQNDRIHIATVQIDTFAYKAAIIYGFNRFETAVTRASTKMRVAPNGLLQSIGNNVPALDYLLSPTCPMWMVEAQANNLFLHSNDFTNAVWIKGNTTISTNTHISPDGTMNAHSLVLAAGTSLKRIIQREVATSAGLKSTSIFVKYTTIRFVQVVINAGVPPIRFCNFDLLNNVVGVPQNGAQQPQIQIFVNGWARISLLGDEATTDGAILNIVNSLVAPINQQTSQTGSLLIFGAQFVHAPFVGTYIPTVASTVTRLADVINKTGISALIGATAGAVFGRFFAGTNKGVVAMWSDGTNDNRILIDYGVLVAGQLRAVITQAANEQIYTESPTPNAVNAYCYTYIAGEGRLYLNAVWNGETNDITVPIGMNRFDLGSNLGANTFFNGRLGAHGSVPTAITVAKAIELSTL